MIDKKTEVADLDILGMSCVNCAKSIQTYISKLNGINSISLNYGAEVAHIDYVPDEISLDEIKSTVRKLGYDVAEDDDEEALEAEKAKSLKTLRIKIITAIVLSVIVMAISMHEHFSFLGFLAMPMTTGMSILFLLSTVIIFYCGSKFLNGAIKAAKNKTSDMNTLISLGIFSSYIYSTVVLANHLLHLNIVSLNNAHEVYFETSAMIVTFILMGNYLEASMKARTNSSIKKLKQLQSKFVHIIRDGNEIQVPLKKVKVKDIVIIRAGDKVPVDGDISEGSCIVDESALTGESMPAEKSEGDELKSGTVVINGFVKLSAQKVGKDTTLSKIIGLVKEASNSKPKIQRLADKISAIFVPVVVGVAIATFLIWLLVMDYPFDRSLLFAVSVLIVACPCALGLASPIAVIIGVGRSAENGILFNNVEAIEKLNKIDTICFDKTGTVTTGAMKIKNIEALNGISKDEIVKYAFSIEKFSNHPIAKSISNYSKSRNIELISEVRDISNENGMGISGYVQDKMVIIGNEKMMTGKGIDIAALKYNDKSGMLLVSIDNKLSGIIEFEDTIRDDTKEEVAKLKDRNLGLYMISGDNETVTKKIADEIGIEKYSYKTMPEDKEKIISKLQSEGKNVAMIGDGINDAPALARANVGMAIGTGTDIAIDTADAILVKGDLKNIIRAINMSGHTVRIIKQNIFWAFFYNALAIPLAAGILAPVGIVVSPVMSAMLMAFSDVVTVVGNSLRLKTFNINK
jgi:Cu+-exporting ATPase